jgi:hypothetical protein
MRFEQRLAADYRRRAEELLIVASSITDQAGRREVVAVAHDCLRRAAQFEEIERKFPAPTGSGG